MTFDFDTPLLLSDAYCQKYDLLPSLFGIDAEDGIPMWVADMDFAAAPAIRAALTEEIERGYMGYFAVDGPATEATVAWMRDRHGVTLDPAHVRWSRGVIDGLAMTLDALTEPGDGVIVFSPVYHAFFGRMEAMERVVVESPLREVDGRFEMDLEALEASLTGTEKMVVFCSPHNPGGRIWSGDEIRALCAFCDRNDLWLVSDEIHMDLVFPGAEFTSTLKAAPDVADRLVLLSAASKGFNIAGGETAFVVIPGDAARARYDRSRKKIGGTPNRFGMAMVRAAFAESGDWSDAVRAYLAENFAIWRDRVGALPGISVMDMTATYLSWVDFTGTGLSEGEIEDRLRKGARLAASPGTQFRTGGDLHRRFNLALPRPTLMEAIDRMEAAFADLQ